MNSQGCSSGALELKKARIRWFLSTNAAWLPEAHRVANKAYRFLSIAGESVDFSNVFNDLHTQSYVEIMKGNGFEISTSLAALKTAFSIRKSSPFGKAKC